MKKRNPEPESKPGFIRKTVTIPGELSGFVERETEKPAHAGNLSSYIRSLILRDREEKLKAA